MNWLIWLLPLCLNASAFAADETSSNQITDSKHNTITDGNGTQQKSEPQAEVVHRRLDVGPLLLAPEDDTIVETPFGSVSVAADSLALIVTTQQALSVYDLHDGSKIAILISDGTHVDPAIPLIPGHMAVLVKTPNDTFEEVNVAQFVKYRLLTNKLLPSKRSLYQAQFDVMSLMHGLPALKKLLDSDNPRTKKVMQNVLKIIMDQIAPSSEPYRYYAPPEASQKQ